ncbi:hypothetical protein CTI12_AA019600 [Artemisia annua]|uniref:K Homology domain-containing protein n=1 Tax=Artemisia annua TaxID=35608 RepID=A0A2U1Q8Y7_ARTAN|nr:hypothetical protein CTI12_AA019600 [Artemisia annua]
MDQEQKIDKYAKAKIEDPNPHFPKSLLKPGSDPTTNLTYTKIFEEDNRRAQHLAEEIAAGAQFSRKVYRIRYVDLAKVLEKDFEGMLPIHRASKATIGLLSDDETIKHRHSYIDLVGTVEQVKMAEELILDKVLKTYSSDCYPVILMPPTIHEYEMKITFDKVSSILGLFRVKILTLEMTSGTWITCSPPPPPGVIEQERVATIYGPRENVIKAVSLIRSAMSQPMESFEGESDFKEPMEGASGGSSTDQDERDLKQKAEQESKERERKGKAKVEESDDVPAPTPEIRSFIDNDHHYIKIIGQLPVGPNSVEGVTRELVRIRAKDVQKILGNQDGMLMSIHSVSGATIGIFTDATARFHCHAYLELLGTADQIKIAELLVTDAITEIYDASSVPTAIMPLDICHKSMNIPFLKVFPLLGIGDTNLTRIEAESGTWLEVDETAPPVDGKEWESTVKIYGSKQQVKNAMEMISAIVYKGPVLPANEGDLRIEEIGYNEEGEKQDFAAWEDELETSYENHGWENIREVDFGKGGSGEESAHKECAASGSVTQKNDEESEDKKSVNEEEQKEDVESGSGTQKNVEESEDKKSVNEEEQKEDVESGSGTQKNVEGSEDKKSVKKDEQKECVDTGSGAQKNVEGAASPDSNISNI